MALVAALADRTVSISRRTAYLVDPAPAAASMTVARQPPQASCARVAVLAGTTGSGTVTITGTVAGVAGQTETLTFTGNATKSGTRLFTAISSVTTTGLADEAVPPTVSVSAVDQGGADQAQEEALAANLPAGMKQSANRWPVAQQGSEVPDRWRLYLDWSDLFTLRRGDIVTEDSNGNRWMVEAPPPTSGTLRMSHLQVEVSRVPA